MTKHTYALVILKYSRISIAQTVVFHSLIKNCIHMNLTIIHFLVISSSDHFSLDVLFHRLLSAISSSTVAIPGFQFGPSIDMSLSS